MHLNQMSLRTRLFASMSVILAIVLSLVFYAQYVNSKTTRHNVESSQVHNEINHSLVKINSILHILETEIYEQSIITDEDRIDSINQTYSILIQEITVLTDNKTLQSFIEKNKQKDESKYLQLKNLGLKTLLNVTALRPKITQLNKMAANHLIRYTAMPVVEQYLLPINQEIELALSQSLKSEPETGLTKKQSIYIRKLYYEARYTWSKHIHYVRLFISNRLGVFGEQRKSIKQNLHNRKIYLDQFLSLINILKKQQAEGNLDLIQEENLNTILHLIPLYDKYFEQIREIHLSDNWRSDLVLIEKEIQPQLDLIWEKIVQMQKIVRAQLNESIALSQSTARKTATIIWSSAAIIVLTLIAIYFVFEFSIRRPISVVAKALDDEAQGKPGIKITDSFAEEINYLLNAFSNMRKQVHTRQFRLQSILDNAFEGIIITNDKCVIESFNNAAQLLFEYSEAEIANQNISKLFPWPYAQNEMVEQPHNQHSLISNTIGQKLEITGFKKGNHPVPISVKINETYINGKRNFITTVEDISERKALMDDLEYQANHDSLTSLYNRHYFTKELNNVVNQGSRGTNNQHAILYIDLDNFKYINDTIGHLAGDQLISEIAVLLQNRVRKTDVLARLGGDEFAILLYHDNNIHLEYVADCFVKLIREYVFKYEKHVVDVSCSIGGAYLNADVETKEQLLARADFSCHESKRLGRNQAYIYSKKDDSQVSDMSRDIGWTRRIKEALTNDHFLLACQPIYETKTDKVDYYEILLRMVGLDEKIIMPFGFLPAAERFGLMLEIDSWVLRNSIRLLALQQQFEPNLKFSINLSAHSIDNPATYTIIKNEIEKNSVNPESILFEVTETIAIANLTVATKLLSSIQTLGCKTALDDFGVGYSSFAYLADLPVDIVKIDGFFVKDMETKHLNMIMVRSINDIAHALGKTTVAEFVENEHTYQLLKKLNVDYSQGYHLGKPIIIYDESIPIRNLFKTEDTLKAPITHKK